MGTPSDLGADDFVVNLTEEQQTIDDLNRTRMVVICADWSLRRQVGAQGFVDLCQELGLDEAMPEVLTPEQLSTAATHMYFPTEED